MNGWRILIFEGRMKDQLSLRVLVQHFRIMYCFKTVVFKPWVGTHLMGHDLMGGSRKDGSSHLVTADLTLVTFVF